MKTIFVEARLKARVELPANAVKELPAKIALFATVQFIDSIGAIKKQIEGAGKKVLLLKPKHSKYEGQLLGCGIEKFSGRFDAFLYVGDGNFHPMALMLKNDKPVFTFNPYTGQFRQMDGSEAKRIQGRVKAALAKFHSADNVGVILSTKPGQARWKEAFGLEKKFPDKKFYYIVFDTIDFSQMENFSFCEVFVNTACPRIGYDDALRMEKKIINIEDL